MTRRTKVIITVLAIIAVAVLVGLWVVFVDIDRQQYIDLVVGHFPAVVGLPMAAIAAFVLVAYLQQRSGEGVRFKGLGFEFEGPSGQVVLWAICFIVIALMIKVLW